MRPLRLHGYAVSNYFNVMHAALIEKQVAFEIVTQRANQSPELLAHSPMGKIPFLETPQGWLSETVAMLEYLEDTLGGPYLHPADRFQRARVRQVINLVQLYIEMPVRSLFPGVFLGGQNSPATVDAARAMIARASAALTQLGCPSRYLLGDELTYADLFAFYCFDIAERVIGFVDGRSLLAGSPGMTDWFARMQQRDSSRLVLANFAPAFASYLHEKGAAYPHAQPDSDSTKEHNA